MSIIKFGPFRFDTVQILLWRDDELLSVSPKALAVLAELIKHAGQPVSKDDLLSAVWPDMVVSESVLTVRIRALRKVLGDSSQTSTLIETLHRYGYRFIGDIETLPTAPESQEALHSSQPWPEATGSTRFRVYPNKGT